MMHTPARTHEMSLERARMAARLAAQAHLNSLDEEEQSNAPGSGLAVLTWGAMAMACSLAAAVTIAIPLVDGHWTRGKLAKSEISSIQNETSADNSEIALSSPDVSDNLLASDNTSLDEIAATAPPPSAPITGELKTSSNEPLDEMIVAAVEPDETILNRGDAAQQLQQTPALDQNSFTVSIPLPKSAVSMEMQLSALKRRAPRLFSAKALEADNAGTSLIVGPFASPTEIARFCRNVKLSLTLDCKAG